MERHVLIDHVRRPFSAILEKNLRKGKVRDDKTWILSLSQFQDDQSIALNAIIFSSPNLDTGSTRSPDHWCAISKWRLVESVAPSKAPASTKNPETAKRHK